MVLPNNEKRHATHARTLEADSVTQSARGWGLALGLGLVALAVAACGGEDEKRAGALNPSTCAPPCGGPSRDASADRTQQPEEDVVEQEAESPDATDAPNEPYEGPVGSAKAVPFISNPPEFDINPGHEMPLAIEADVTVLAAGSEYTAHYTPNTEFVMQDLPVGTWPVIVSGKDLASTLLPQAVVEGQQSDWQPPVLGNTAFVVIYHTLPTPLYRDPFRAQVLLTFESCAQKGGKRLAGVKVTAPEQSQGVVYDSSQGWQHNGTAGTGSKGVAFVANIEAQPRPGSDLTLTYELDGQTYTLDSVPVMQDTVTRVPVVVPCP